MLTHTLIEQHHKCRALKEEDIIREWPPPDATSICRKRASSAATTLTMRSLTSNSRKEIHVRWNWPRLNITVTIPQVGIKRRYNNVLVDSDKQQQIEMFLGMKQQSFFPSLKLLYKVS